MISAEKVIIALDTQDPQKLANLYKHLEDQKVWIKIGMELFYSMGPKAVFDAKDKGFKVFLDLKLHDIPNTVGQATKALLGLPIDMLNVHAAGGLEMMKAAATVKQKNSSSTLLIAVTQLTSTTQAEMNSEQRIEGSVLESVLNFAKLAKAAGCDGVVSSPLEVEAIKAACGKSFLTVTPGIRPAGTDVQDQKRITTPADAMKLGSDFLVIGRPITGAPDPKAALEAILRG